MKKFGILLVMASMLLASCSDDGKSSAKAKKKVTNIPTQQEFTEISKDVTSMMSQTKAEPGSVDFCKELGKVLDDYESLNLASADYDDEDLDQKAQSIQGLIDQCRGNKDVDAFDWYDDGIKAAVSKCEQPQGVNVVAFYKEFLKLINDFDSNCKTLEGMINKLVKKHLATVRYLEYFNCEDYKNCPTAVCTDKWLLEAAGSETAAAQMIIKIFEVVAECEFKYFGYSDPCASVTCKSNEVCDIGECVELCRFVECESNATCKNGLCIPKSCKEDASICKDGETCNDKGVCEKKQPEITCKEDASICKDGETCNDKGVCEKKQPEITCKDDPSICKDGETCNDKGVCERQDSSAPGCDSLPNVKKAYTKVYDYFTSSDFNCDQFITIGVDAEAAKKNDRKNFSSEEEMEEVIDDCSELWMKEYQSTITGDQLENFVKNSNASIECIDQLIPDFDI